MKVFKPDLGIEFDKVIEFLGQPSYFGTPPKIISSAAGLDNPNLNSESITFTRTADTNKLSKIINNSPAATFLISTKSGDLDLPAGKCAIKVDNPNLSYIEILEHFFLDTEKEYLPKNIHPTAVIAASAKIAKGVGIGPFVVIGEHCEIDTNVFIHAHSVLYHAVKIGANSILHAHCVIREHVQIGSNCLIQAGAVIGADGFGYLPDPKSGLRMVPQVGTVEIQNSVDIGANACIDRATSDKTIIGFGSKIDNLVQVGHNVNIGKHSILCGQVGVGGSTSIGEQVVLGGQVGVGDHLKIVANTRVGGGSAVTQSIEKAGDYTGSPAMPATSWRRIAIAQRKLPQIIKSLDKS